jgi:protein-S-isoprenylcysteine O-methyltransferase Ste14
VTEAALQRGLALGILGAAAITFLALLFIVAPYGRHARPGWGPTVGARAGWILMESPSALGFLATYALGRHRAELAPLLLCALWEAHYLHRTFIFPFRLPPTSRRMPLSIAAMGASFNCANAYVNARWISELGAYPAGWIGDPRFLAGAFLFVLGATINVRADGALLRLRRGGEYVIPRGGLFDRIASPNYFGELIEWIGFALAAWSLAGLAFAVYTAANLVPRAIAHRRWYREKFPDYPRERRAIVPYVL